MRRAGRLVDAGSAGDDGEIEFLAPSPDRFGLAGDDGAVVDDGFDEHVFDTATPRPRWVRVAAALGLLGLLAGAVVAAAPWADEAARPTPTTVPTTVPTRAAAGLALTSAQLDPREIGFVIDDPDWQVTSVASATTGGSSGQFELWATPGASRTFGSWVAVHAPVVPVLNTTEGNASDDRSVERVRVGDDTAVVDVTADGVTTFSLGSFDEGIQFTSFGWSLDQLIALAGTRVSAVVHPVDVTAVRTDHVEIISRRSAATTLQDELVHDASAVTRLVRDDGATLVLTVQSISDDQRRLEPFVRREPAPGGVFAAEAPWRSLTMQDVGDRTLVVASSLEPDELSRLAGVVRPATADEWVALRQLDRVALPLHDRRFVEIASGATASGVGFTVEVDRNGSDDALVGFDISDGSAGSKRLFRLTDAGLTVAHTGPATVAVWRLPFDAVPAGAEAIVVSGVDAGVEWAHTAPLIPMARAAGWVYAATVVSELGPVTGVFVDASGNPLGPAS